jgi:hypothetical protein
MRVHPFFIPAIACMCWGLALFACTVSAAAGEKPACLMTLSLMKEVAKAPVKHLTDAQLHQFINSTSVDSRPILAPVTQGWWTYVTADDAVDKSHVVVVGFTKDNCAVAHEQIETDKFLSIINGDPA